MGERSDGRAAAPGLIGGRARRDRARRAAAAAVLCLLAPLLPLAAGTASAAAGDAVPADSEEIPYTVVQDGVHWGEYFDEFGTWLIFTTCQVDMWAQLDLGDYVTPRSDGTYELYHERIWTPSWSEDEIRTFDRTVIDADGRYWLDGDSGAMWDVDDDGVDDYLADGGDVDCLASDIAAVTGYPYASEHRFYTLTEMELLANFDHEVTNPSTGEVSFTSTSVEPAGSDVTYLWDFDDWNEETGDATSTEKNPVHTFSEPGTYYVNLEVTDEEGNKDDWSREVEVKAPELDLQLSVEGEGEELELAVGEEAELQLVVSVGAGLGEVSSVTPNDIVPVRLPGNLELVGEWGFSPGERFTLQPDTSRIFTWTVTVTGPGDGEITTEWYGKNIAEDNVGPVTDVLPFTVSTGLDVDLEMDLATATMGDPVAITMTVTNELAEEAVVDISALLEAAWDPSEIDGAEPEISVLSPDSVAVLAAGESAELSATITGTAPGTLTVTGRASGTQESSGAAIDGLDEAELTIDDLPLNVEVTADPERVAEGEDVAVTITVTNESEGAVTDMAGELDVEWEPLDESTDDPTVGELEPATVASLQPGGTVEIEATIVASGPGTLALTANAAATDASGGTALSDKAEVEVTVVGLLVVNSDGDAADEDPEDGACDTGDTVEIEGDEVAECTLRAAIQEANERGEGAEITFDIPGAGVPTVAPAAPLPALAGPSVLDGTSQPGGKVELSGGDGDGLVLDGSGVEVRGLVVTGFAGAGLVLGGDGGHSVASSWIGVGPDGSGTDGNTEAGIRVESAGNTIGGSAEEANVIANNGDQEAPGEPEPGTDEDDVEADVAELTANVLFGDGGGGTVSHNELGAGTGVATLGETAAIAVEENEITGTVGVVAVASTPTAMGATIARNTFDGAGGSTVIGIVVAGGGATSTEVTANTFEDVGVPVLAAGVPDAAPLRVGDNEATGVSLGVLMLGVAGATVDGNSIDGTIGVFSAGDASSSLGHNTFSGNTFASDVGMVLAGENADEVTSNRFEGELGALYVATSEVVTSANTFDSDVGLVSIGPGLPAFGHNRYESNHLNGDLGMVLAGEDSNELIDNTFTDNDLALLISTSQASKLTGNTISGGTIGMGLINVGGAEITGNTVTGTKLGVLVVAGEPSDEEKAQGDAEDAPTDSEDIFDAAFGGAAGDAALAWANAGQDHVEIDHTTIYRSPVSGARNIWTGNTISGNVLGMMVGGEVNANEIGGASAALANTITGNSTVGLLLAGAPGPQDVTIRGNVIHGNGTAGHEDVPAGIPDLKLVPGVSDTPDPSAFLPLANDLGDGDSGPNGLQNHPVLTRVAADGTSAAGELWTSPGSYIVDLYATSSCHSSGHGGAHRYLGEVPVTVAAGGRAGFEATVALAPGEVLTATATSTGAFADGGTSEFSRCAARGQTGTTSTEGAAAGDDRIEVGEDHDVEVGDDVIINPGGANEETANVTGHGSLIFAEPLKFDHEPGEPIVVVPAAPPIPGPGPGPAPGPGPDDPDGPSPTGCVGIQVPSAGFSDVAGGSTHAAAIDCLASLGIADGRSDGTYGPARPVTRGQFASLLSRLAAHLGAELPADAADAFDDDAEPHESALNRLAAAGVIRGTGDRRANPGAPITRAQAATMIHRLWPLVTGEPLAPGADHFDDDDGTVHEPAIDALAAAGIVQGTADRRFTPNAPTRRDEAATLLARALTNATKG